MIPAIITTILSAIFMISVSSTAKKISEAKNTKEAISYAVDALVSLVLFLLVNIAYLLIKIGEKL